MNYVTRHEQGTRMNDGNTHIIQKGIKDYINHLCIQNLSTYEGRQSAASRHLDTSHLVPIFIDETILLVPSKSLRDPTMIFVNYHQIKTVKIENKKVMIVFVDHTEICLDITFHKWQTQIKKAQKLWELYICANQKESVYTLGFLLDFL